MMPTLASSARNVVATETESNTASTATPLRRFCSSREIPSFSNVRRSSGSTSSIEFNVFFCFGAECEVTQRHLLERALDRTVDAEHEAPRRTGHADRAEGVAAVVGSLALDEVPRPLEDVEELPERGGLGIAVERVAAADAAVRL